MYVFIFSGSQDSREGKCTADTPTGFYRSILTNDWILQAFGSKHYIRSGSNKNRTVSDGISCVQSRPKMEQTVRSNKTLWINEKKPCIFIYCSFDSNFQMGYYRRKIKQKDEWNVFIVSFNYRVKLQPFHTNLYWWFLFYSLLQTGIWSSSILQFRNETHHRCI